jgi:hypothetical protein
MLTRPSVEETRALQRLRKVSDEDVARWSLWLFIASRENVSVLDRLRLVYRMLDEMAMILWGVKPQDRHRRLAREKCGVDMPQKGMGEWIIETIYDEKLKKQYMVERLERVRCIAELAFAIICDLRRG